MPSAIHAPAVASREPASGLVTGHALELARCVLQGFDERYPLADIFWEDSRQVVLCTDGHAATADVRCRRGLQFRVVGRREACSSWTTDLSARGLRRALEALRTGLPIPRTIPAWRSSGHHAGLAPRRIVQWREWLETLAVCPLPSHQRRRRIRASASIEQCSRGVASSPEQVRAWSTGRVIVTLEVVDRHQVRGVRSMVLGEVPQTGDRERCERALLDLDDHARRSPSLGGVMPVVLAPGSGMLMLHEIVGHALEADRLLTGASALSGLAPGTLVSHPDLTIRDSPDTAWGPGGLELDDEGEAGRDTVLIKEGRLAGAMHDRATAFVSRAAATGNGRRASFETLPSPRMRNLVVDPGPADPCALIRQVEKGLYVERLSGSVDPSTQWFDLIVESGRVIVRGICRERVRGLRIRGRTRDALREVRGVANDVTVSWEPVWCEKLGSVVTGVAGPTVLMGPLEVRP